MYYESIFVLNFLLDFMILYGTKRILKIVCSMRRLFFSSLFGSVTIIFLFFSFSTILLLFLKVMIGFFLVGIAFGFRNLIKNTFYFYLISILLGGFFYLFDISKSSFFSYLFILIGSFLVIMILIFEFLRYRDIYPNKYFVTFFYQNKDYQLEGFLDTGNQLVSPIKRESIILVDLDISIDQVIYVPYKALNTSGVIPCFRPDKVLINHKVFTNCLIGIAHDKFSLDGTNCILPNKLKEDLC